MSSEIKDCFLVNTTTTNCVVEKDNKCDTDSLMLLAEVATETSLNNNNYE